MRLLSEITTIIDKKCNEEESENVTVFKNISF